MLSLFTRSSDGALDRARTLKGNLKFHMRHRIFKIVEMRNRHRRAFRLARHADRHLTRRIEAIYRFDALARAIIAPLHRLPRSCGQPDPQRPCRGGMPGSRADFIKLRCFVTAAAFASIPQIIDTIEITCGK
ncbi:hypothetical protein [Burkholderia glumae]|uniref:hypothetical protein n=1 Tax=Burkholderia glumae TaxID=337 RepID=UPI0013749FE7|nr:hypothetical protein [Burkholderia glumae]